MPVFRESLGCRRFVLDCDNRLCADQPFRWMLAVLHQVLHRFFTSSLAHSIPDLISQENGADSPIG
jgi:hypothetical protein